MKMLKNNKAVKFIVTLFLVGFVVGIITFITFKPEMGAYLSDFAKMVSTNHINSFLLNIGLISLVFVLSISLIGSPLIFVYLFYEGFSIGYTLMSFTITFGYKGFIFYLLYFIVVKLIFDICILYFCYMSIKFDYKVTYNLVNKKKDIVYKIFVNQLYRYIILLVVIVVNSTIMYFLGNKLISLFLPLISK